MSFVAKLVCAVAMAFTLQGCGPSPSSCICDVHGLGSAQSELRAVGSFSGLKVENAIHADVTVGSTASVKVTAQANILSHIQTSVSGGFLTLSVDCHVCSTELPMEVAIVVLAPLNSVTASGAAHVTADKVGGPLTASGASKLTVGNITTSGEVGLTASGASHITVSGGTFDAQVTAGGASSVTLDGVTSKTAALSASGASQVSGATTDTVRIQATGASTVSVTATGEANIEQCNGASTVKISGGARIESGSVSKYTCHITTSSSFSQVATPNIELV